MKKDYSDNDLKELFKGKFSEEFQTPPAEAWSTIQAQIGNSNRKPRFVFWFISIAIVFFGGMVWILKDNNYNSEINITNPVEKSNNNQNTSKSVSKKTLFSKKEDRQNEESSNKKDRNPQNPSNSSSDKTLSSNKLSKKSRSINPTENYFHPSKEAELIRKSDLKSEFYLKKVTEYSTKESKAKNELKSVVSSSKPIDNSVSISSQNEQKPTENNSGLGNKTKENQLAKNKVLERKILEEKSNQIELNAENKQFKDSIKNIDTAPNLTPNSQNEVNNVSNLLLTKTSKSIRFNFDVFFGIGRSPRVNKIVSPNSPLVLTDNIVRLKNRKIGMNIRYQFNPYLGFRTGVSLGSNRSRTRLFPVSIANSQLNQNLEIATSVGTLRSTNLEENALQVNNSDTSIYLMRIVHRSGYLNIPVSIYLNTRRKPNAFYFYSMTGFDFAFRGRERSYLIVRSDENERNIRLEKLKNGKNLETNWHLSLGAAYPFQTHFEIFSEFNYSLNIYNDLNNSFLNTKYSYFQLIFGIRF